MSEEAKFRELSEYRKAIRGHFVDRFNWHKYPDDEPVASDFVFGQSSEYEIMRARMAGIADAIEESDTLDIAFALFSRRGFRRSDLFDDE